MIYFTRIIEENIKKSLLNFPAVAIIGPCQCGKTTMVKHVFKNKNNIVYLDLERNADLRKLDDPELFFTSQEKGTLFCIDEVQRKPELFATARYLIDEWQENGRFLFLGSASRDLLRQSSETLAGRISYKQLTPFLLNELPLKIPLQDYYVKGAFPKSIISDIKTSHEWRENFITTFLERDLLQWKNFTPDLMRRLWMMLAHNNGQTVNYSALSKSLGVNDGTVKNYIDLLDATFMLYVIPPYISNMGKRLIKAPKIYIADSGITTSLLNIYSFESLIGHSIFGAIWEQMVLLNLTGHFPTAEFYFYRTTHGAEIDFVMIYQDNIIAIECKSSVAPLLSKGNYNAIEDINPHRVFVVCPINESYPIALNIEAISLYSLCARITELYDKI